MTTTAESGLGKAERLTDHNATTVTFNNLLWKEVAIKEEQKAMASTPIISTTISLDHDGMCSPSRIFAGPYTLGQNLES
jgi:hypothetical protein